MNLEACVLYFVKATINNFGENGVMLKTALLNNGTFETKDSEENLFWILPGKTLVK